MVLLVAVGYAVFAPPGVVKRQLLPGVTTHGHYQIEMDCNACHTAGMGIDQESCLNCHAEELREAKDTHPASKFRDPTFADNLEILDAQKCTTCHREHVEDQTLAMGLTVPDDYCYHCHQDTLETRPSHQNLEFDSCATAGCHNYHDNRALYENFLHKHYGEPDFLDSPLVKKRTLPTEGLQILTADHADAPAEFSIDPELVAGWANSQHAEYGVNCSHCHEESDEVSHVGQHQQGWNATVSTDTCKACHRQEVISFGAGKHGMKWAQGLPAMQPGLARAEMRNDAIHKELNCNACHPAHEYQTDFVAVTACLQCHADEHSLAFKRSSHFALWEQEKTGDLPAGSGVTCATCHMPRLVNEQGNVWVQHNQNANLRPNEKMIRDVCMNCHGLQFSLDSLADPDLIESCFNGTPARKVESLEMAKSWFDKKEEERKARQRKRAKGNKS